MPTRQLPTSCKTLWLILVVAIVGGEVDAIVGSCGQYNCNVESCQLAAAVYTISLWQQSIQLQRRVFGCGQYNFNVESLAATNTKAL